MPASSSCKRPETCLAPRCQTPLRQQRQNPCLTPRCQTPVRQPRCRTPLRQLRSRRKRQMAAVDTVFEQLGTMTVLELVELKKKIEDEWGITAAAPVAVAAAGGGDGAAV